MLLEGIFLPLTTPFHPDGRLFLHKLAVNVEHYSRTQASGMLVLGREGEGDSLTDAETIEVLRSAIAAAADDKVMIANVGRESVAATLQFVEAAAAAGYDAVALRPPLGRRPEMDWEAAVFFRTVADRSPLPVVVVNDIKRSTFAGHLGEIAQHPNIIGAIHSERSPLPEGYTTAQQRMPHHGLTALLAATTGVRREVTVTNIFTAVTGRMARHAATAGNFVSAASLGGIATKVVPAVPSLKTRSKSVGFQVLAGSSRTMLETWGMGTSGAVPRLAACAPQACCEVWQAFKDGDSALAAEKQERIRGAAELVEGKAMSDEFLSLRRGIAALKYGCDLNSYFGGRPRLPLLPLSDDERGRVEDALAGLKN